MRTPTPLSLLQGGLVAAALVFGGLHAEAAPAVSLVATPNPAVAGGSFTLAVDASDVIDLYAWQFSLVFDPTLFQAAGATEGAFLASAGSTFFDGGIVDNAAGTVTFALDTLVGAVPGASGSGLLESLSFRSLSAGTGAFSLRDVQLLDSGLNGIAVGTASINVAAVPEASAATLLLAGLAVLAVAVRPRRRSGFSGPSAAAATAS